MANVVDLVARWRCRVTEIEGRRAKPLDAGIVVCIFVWEGVDWIVGKREVCREEKKKS